MSKILEKKIESLEEKVNRLELIIEEAAQRGDWIYDPKIIALLKTRASQAEKELKGGKTLSIEKLKEKLGV